MPAPAVAGPGGWLEWAMTSDAPEHNAPAERSIAELVNEYFDRRQSGENLTPERFAAEHPGLAGELAPYMEGLALIDQARSAAELEHGLPPELLGAGLPAISGYQVQAEIGRGGMGVIYRALQVATRRTVALKVMLAAPFASEMARRRFAREVELAARLDHPGIVRVLESGTVAAQPYYAMDYVEGLRLDRYLAEVGLAVPEILKLFIAVCAAVDHAHQHGVIHRDLKPGNVLVDEGGQPHVLDFGLAKAVDQSDASQTLSGTLSSPGQVLGTLGYLSPEQAAGNTAEIGTRTDVYALGVMLFEALTGRLPIDLSGRPSEVIQRIQEAPPIPPTQLSRRVDAELETIVLKTLAKDPTQRYASVRELADDLSRYLNSEPILARRPSSFYVLRKKFIKHRLRIALGVTVGVVALLGLWGGVWWSARQRAEQAARELVAARHEALRAQQVLDVGDIEAASRAAHAVATRCPELIDGLLVLAHAQYRARSVEQAIVILERASGPASSSWAASTLLAEVYRSIGDASRADELAAAAARNRPDTAEAWYLRSLATLSASDAAEYTEQAVRRDPGHTLGWARLAYLHIRAGKLDPALHAVERLIALEPKNGQWRALQGEVLVRRHEFQRAIELYTDLIQNSPHPEALYPYRAVAYRRMKHYAEAIADYDHILSLAAPRPGTLPVWYRYQRATPLWMSGRVDEAEADYRQVRATLGHAHYADARLVIILHGAGRKAEVEAILLAARQTVDDPWLEKIFACLTGELSPAELAGAAAAKTVARQCEAYYYAGEACLMRNEPAEARDWFEKCVQTGVEFDPSNVFLLPMNEYELAEWRLESLPTAATQSNRG